MKNIILIFLLCISVMACKAKKSTAQTTPDNPAQTTAVGATTGKVSHMYKATGCETVVIVKNGDSELTLIPKDKLNKQFDVDGLEITFNYRTLKMPNPAGCAVGMPAELTDISKK